MIDFDKKEFSNVIKSLKNIPFLKSPDKITPEMVAMYWAALEHRTLSDVKLALNRHIQDADRGRFFPLPADIAAQLPSEANAWLTADEAWATCPKDESVSAAMCDEIGAALGIAADLIGMGDMIAARRAFIDHYNRLANEAKQEGRNAKWWPSLGHDKFGRYKAKVEVVERNNLMLRPSERLALPGPEITNQESMKSLISSIPVKSIDSEERKKLSENLKRLKDRIKYSDQKKRPGR